MHPSTSFKHSLATNTTSTRRKVSNKNVGTTALIFRCCGNNFSSICRTLVGFFILAAIVVWMFNVVTILRHPMIRLVHNHERHSMIQLTKDFKAAQNQNNNSKRSTRALVGSLHKNVTASLLQLQHPMSLSSSLPAVLHYPITFYLEGALAASIPNNSKPLSEELQVELDGLSGSRALHLISPGGVNISMTYPNVSWFGSLRYFQVCNEGWIRQAVEYYKDLQPPESPSQRRKRRRQQQLERLERMNQSTSISNNDSLSYDFHIPLAPIVKQDWTIHLIDWYDNPERLLHCPKMHRLIGKSKFRYWKRSVVQERRWNNVTQSIELGRIVTNVDGAPIHFVSFPVRSGMADLIRNLVQQEHIQQQQLENGGNDTTAILSTDALISTMNATTLTNYLVNKDRPGDVAHFWPVKGGKVDRGSKFVLNSQLRTKTSETLLSMLAPPYNVSSVFCDEAGRVGTYARKVVSNAYVESMLQFKIIVVVQRDNWEGHWRLMEAMISGAMVIHDRMLAVPYGLKENVNIVIFDTMDELKSKVMYYLTHPMERLEIARRGRQLAMCYHRSWHLIERIVIGNAVTPMSRMKGGIPSNRSIST